MLQDESVKYYNISMLNILMLVAVLAAVALLRTTAWCEDIRPSQTPVLPPVTHFEGVPPLSIYAARIVVAGSTVFSDDDFQEITYPLEGRYLTSEDLETLRQKLTRLYVERGYINSGAVIPDQDIQDGVITYQIIEGELSAVEISGNRWFQERWLARRLTSQAPLKIQDLETRLQLLQRDSRIERFEAALQPGLRPGQSILQVEVEETHPVQMGAVVNNYQSPAVGAIRGQLSLEHHNLTGRGDMLQAAIARSAGVNPQITAAYTLPLTVQDTLLKATYRKNDFFVVDEMFRELDVESQSTVYGLTLAHPFWRTLTDELTLSLTLEKLHNETFLAGERFSFGAGSEEGRARVVALRGSQEYLHRHANYIISLRSRLSVGLDTGGVTRHTDPELPDGRFVSWLGQAHVAQRLPGRSSQILWRTDLQLANKPLLSLEQIAAGGRYTVRGYRENRLVRDNALISSLEYRQLLVQNHVWAGTLWLVPFADYGRAWSARGPTPNSATLSSVGLGIIWELTLGQTRQIRPQFELFWGYALRRSELRSYDLQDDGLHFQVALTAF